MSGPIKPIEGLTDEEWDAFVAAAEGRGPNCLLPDDDTAVERLAAVLPWFGEWYGNSVEMNQLDESIGPQESTEEEHDAAWLRLAAAIIAALREGDR